MLWRDFLQGMKTIILGPEPRPEPLDPLQRVYADSLLLLERIYAGQSHSRRRVHQLSQPRWQAAYHLCQAAGILTPAGKLAWWVAPNVETAEILLRQTLNQQRLNRRRGERRQGGGPDNNYVIPFR